MLSVYQNKRWTMTSSAFLMHTLFLYATPKYKNIYILKKEKCYHMLSALSK